MTRWFPPTNTVTSTAFGRPEHSGKLEENRSAPMKWAASVSFRYPYGTSSLANFPSNDGTSIFCGQASAQAPHPIQAPGSSSGFMASRVNRRVPRPLRSSALLYIESSFGDIQALRAILTAIAAGCTGNQLCLQGDHLIQQLSFLRRNRVFPGEYSNILLQLLQRSHPAEHHLDPRQDWRKRNAQEAAESCGRTFRSRDPAPSGREARLPPRQGSITTTGCRGPSKAHISFRLPEASNPHNSAESGRIQRCRDTG